MAGAAWPGSRSRSQRWAEALIQWRPPRRVRAGWVGPPRCRAGASGVLWGGTCARKQAFALHGLAVHVLAVGDPCGKKSLSQPQRRQRCLGTRPGHSLSRNPLASVFKINSRSDPFSPPSTPPPWSQHRCSPLTAAGPPMASLPQH